MSPDTDGAFIPLPSFAPHPGGREPGQGASRERENTRERDEKRARDLAVNEVEEAMKEDLADMWPEVCDIIRTRISSGTAEQRYKTSLEWRDFLVGKPATGVAEQARGPASINIISEIDSQLAQAKEAHGR